MPRQSRKREGRRDTGPIRGVIAGAISRRAPRSRVVANTAARWVPKRRKAPWSFGNRRSSRGGGGRGPLAVSLQRGGVSSPPDAEMRRPGCSRERSRRGSSPVKRRVLRSAPSARAGHGGESHRGSRGSLSPAGFSCAQARGGLCASRRSVSNVGSSSPRKRGRKGGRWPLAIHGRGSAARRVCPRVSVVLQKSAGVAWPREA